MERVLKAISKLTSVSELYLSDVAGGANAIDALENMHLTKCGIKYNSIGDAGILRFASRVESKLIDLSNSPLRVLGLIGNSITDIGANVLAKVLPSFHCWRKIVD